TVSMKSMRISAALCRTVRRLLPDATPAAAGAPSQVSRPDGSRIAPTRKINDLTERRADQRIRRRIDGRIGMGYYWTVFILLIALFGGGGLIAIVQGYRMLKGVDRARFNRRN